MATVEAAPVEAPAPARSRFHAGFRPDIEGLRAIAVMTVLAFHAAVPFTSGGFVGVDVFFVISGFLITGLMLVEVSDTGRISLRDFYARRGRRILPSASVVILATGVASWFLLPLLRVRDVAQDMVSSALYVVNWHFIAENTDYLAASTDHSPLLHYWSLAVEEQFYLLWPPLLVVVILLARKLRASWIAATAVALCVLTLGSFALSLVLTSANAPMAYLSSPTRAWQFGVGAALAMLTPSLVRICSRRSVRIVLVVAGWGGLMAIAYATATFDGSTAYPGRAALLPTLGAAAIIAAGASSMGSRGGVAALLSIPPLRSIGRLSFAWYLWHWPVLVFAESITGNTLTWQAKTALVVASALPAWLSLRFIERPIRFSRSISTRTTAGLAVGATATAVSLVAGLLVGSQSLQTLGSVAATSKAPTLAAVFGDARAAAQNSGALSPSPLNAKADRPKPDECILQAHDVTGPACVSGVPGGPTVVLFGDSHAQQWQPALERLALQRGWSLVTVTKAGCPVASIAPRADGSLFSMPECAQWRTESMARIAALHPSLIVASSLWNYIPDKGELLTAWNSSLDQLRSVGAPIAYIRDTPWPGKDIPVCMSGAMQDWSSCAFSRDKAMTSDPVQLEALRGHEDHVTVIDLTGYLCPDAMCPAARSGTLFYRDDSHITATLSTVLAPAIAKALDDAKIAPVAAPGTGDGTTS